MKYDVVVLGGGIGGCAAACAAARNGAKTLLIEESGVLGGQAGLGIVTPYSAWKSRSGANFGGICEEIALGIESLGEKFCTVGAEKESVSPFSASPVVRMHLLKMVTDSGAEIRFHSTFADAVVENGRIVSVRCLGRNGFFTVEGENFIDATGDGALIARSGAEWVLGSEPGVFEALTESGMDQSHYSESKYDEYKENGKMQPVSLFFVMGNVDVENVHKLNNKELKFGDLGITREKFRAWEYAGTCGFEENGDRIPMPQGRVLITHGVRPDQAVVNMSRVIDINGADADSLNEGEIKAQLQLVALVDFLQKFVPGFENSYLIQCASTLGIRETRRLVGRTVLRGRDVIQCKHFPDAIARGSYMVDIHDPNGKARAIGGDLQGDYYEIPYGCLVANEPVNLLACGRCISADHVAHSSTRIQGTCAMTGEAAGTAAAMSAARKILPAELPVEELQAQLKRAGVNLD